MGRKHLIILSFALVIALLSGCTGGGSGEVGVNRELQNRVAQMVKAWDNLDRASIKSLYGRNFTAHYADQNEIAKEFMDELGISVLTYDLCMELVDFVVDVYRYLEDAGATVKFEYEDFRLVHHSDDIAQTSQMTVVTLSYEGTTEITKTKGVVTWEKQGSSWKIVSEGQAR